MSGRALGIQTHHQRDGEARTASANPDAPETEGAPGVEMIDGVPIPRSKPVLPAEPVLPTYDQPTGNILLDKPCDVNAAALAALRGELATARP